jgi:thiol-disulfide isomerase/thioredoxin
VAGPPLTQSLAAGALVPDFSAPDLSWDAVVWKGRDGSPTVLAVWAPWCPHCQKELPVLASVTSDFLGAKPISVVTAVGLHPGPTPEEFMRSRGLTFPVAVDDASGTLGSGLGISAFPTVYYVGSDGRVTAVQVGEWSESEMRRALSRTRSTARGTTFAEGGVWP